MRMVTKLVAAVQSLRGVRAEEVNQQSRVICRIRKFDATTLARTFGLGFLEKPRATESDLAQTAALCGVRVTPQAVAQRFTPALADFLEGLFQRGMQFPTGHALRAGESGREEQPVGPLSRPACDGQHDYFSPAGVERRQHGRSNGSTVVPVIGCPSATLADAQHCLGPDGPQPDKSVPNDLPVHLADCAAA